MPNRLAVGSEDEQRLGRLRMAICSDRESGGADQLRPPLVLWAVGRQTPLPHYNLARAYVQVPFLNERLVHGRKKNTFCRRGEWVVLLGVYKVIQSRVGVPHAQIVKCTHA